MRSAEELRAEARRIRDSLVAVTDSALRDRLVSQSLELSQRAEALARLPADPEGIRAKIEEYRQMLVSSSGDTENQAVEGMLQDAEEMLTHLQSRR
jgi:hypothetical protein